MLLIFAILTWCPNENVGSRTAELREAEENLNGFYTIRLNDNFSKLGIGRSDANELFSKGWLAEPKKFSYFPAPFLDETFDRRRGRFKIRLEKPKSIQFEIENPIEQNIEFQNANQFFIADLDSHLLPMEELLLARWSLEMFHSEAAQSDIKQFKISKSNLTVGTNQSFQEDWASQRPDGKYVELIFNGSRFELCYYKGSFEYIVSRQSEKVTRLLKRIALNYYIENNTLVLKSADVGNHLPVRITIRLGKTKAELMIEAIELCKFFQLSKNGCRH